MKKNLYSFYWDVGRMGSVKGMFITSPEILESSFGSDVYFGEILGKHSEVYGTLEKKDIKLLSDDQEKVGWLFDLMRGGSVSGYNPLDYIEEYEEDQE